MNKLRLWPRLAALLTTSIVCLCLLVLSQAPALAYGKETWQITFAGTGVNPGTGVGFGFWGWCALGGGVTSTSGTNGDCEFSQYFHAPSGSGFTCQESLDITSWNANGDFFITGTATVNPTSLTGLCLSIFPGPGLASFTNVDLGVIAAPGHHNFGSIFGIRGEFQTQVTLIP
jgi:hypothetical protein